MLATCCRNPTRDEYTTCYSNFIELFKSFGITGGLDDDVWERLGFPVDKNIHGDDVRRLATISQEHQQRGKCLTSSYQRELRDERLQTIRNGIKDKAEEIGKDKDKKLKANDNCVEKVCKLLRKDTVSEEHMEEVGMLEFS